MADMNFKPGDVVQLKSSRGVQDVMTVEQVNDVAQSAHCVWIDPKTKNKKEGDFAFIVLKHFVNPAGRMILR